MIQVHHLSKAFGDFTAINDIAFEIAAGEFVAFPGSSGAGKTTTITMFTPLLKPTSGWIEIDGLNPEELPDEVRRRFGIVFQDPSLDDTLTTQGKHGDARRTSRCSTSRRCRANRNVAQVL